MKNWRGKSAAACGTISLLACAAAVAGASTGKPSIVLVDAADLAQWQTWTAGVSSVSGWQVIAPSVPPNTPIDARVQAIETAALEAVKNGSADRSRLYLAGRGEAAAAVFYTISRVPDLWAAAIALGGSPQAAIDTGRFYAANFSGVPVLWIGTGAGDQALAAKLVEAGLSLEWRGAGKLPLESVFDWLASRTREDFPPAVDCETASPNFARCYWIHVTKFDAAERNDALPSSRIAPVISPALDLGGYGYKTDDPGPGILISFLQEKNSGPLKIGDRIIALEGRPIADAHGYSELMSGFKEDRQVTAMVQRGKERLRLETSVVLPKRPPGVTARVQAKFDAQQKEIQIISRTVAEMQVSIPAQWTPAVLEWNGVPLEKLEPAQGEPRCFQLRLEKELENVGPCDINTR